MTKRSNKPPPRPARVRRAATPAEEHQLLAERYAVSGSDPDEAARLQQQLDSLPIPKRRSPGQLPDGR